MKKSRMIITALILAIILIKGFGEIFYHKNLEIIDETTSEQVSEDSPSQTDPSDGQDSDHRFESEIITETGIFNGQVDNNFIEIKISGVPDEKANIVFLLSEEVKASIEELKLKKDDDVKIQYLENLCGQVVITQMEKLDPISLN